MSKLIRWETPFVDAFFPSVISVFSQSLGDKDLLKIVVAPEGIDKYPKYIVSFERILVFNCFDEGCAPEREWPETEKLDPNPCSCKWIDSPSVESYMRCGEFDEDNNPFPLFHYLIFGGDFNVEIIAKNEPTIEEIRDPTELMIRFQL